MRAFGTVLVGLGLVVMLAGLAYSGVSDWKPSVAAAFWAFVAGTMIAMAGGLLHARA